MDTIRHAPIHAQACIEKAATCLNSFWPLRTFIACNPLKGLEEIPFERAMSLARNLFGARGYLELHHYRQMYESGRIGASDLQEAFGRMRELKSRHAAMSEAPLPGELNPYMLTVSERLDREHGTRVVETVNRQVAKWCAAYLDETQSYWQMPRQGSLYATWLALVESDWTLYIHGCWGWKKALAQLPQSPVEAVEWLLKQLRVDGASAADYLARHLLLLPGWASHLKWREAHGDNAHVVADYLAMRLFYEWQLASQPVRRIYGNWEDAWLALRTVVPQEVSLPDPNSPAQIIEQPDEGYAAVWQEAYEVNYRNRLISALSAAPANRPADGIAVSPDAQIVFCIDVRSEPVRRQIEAIGNYETLGFAGFFGFASRFYEIGSAVVNELCPAIVTPEKVVRETASREVSSNIIGQQSLLDTAYRLRKGLKSTLAGAFGLVDAIGVWSSIPLALKTFSPTRLRDAVRLAVKHDQDTRIDLSSYSREELIALATGNLKAMSLTENFAPLVVLCGHGSTSSNNPYASALDCGACGGNSGKFSARLAAAILNRGDVREGVRANGIAIPDDTVFVAAEHNTTLDTFRFFDTNHFSRRQATALERLRSDLSEAGKRARLARSRRLPSGAVDAFNDPEVRAEDWAQVIPEWGLAGNAAFIAAPRGLTLGLDLEGRTFLHNYDFRKDVDGRVLEIVMTAPMVVAQWINMQYYLSTTDNHIFGSGTKVLHNVVGDFGVMSGQFSDLRTGLPLQSVRRSEHELEHEPMRLLAVLRAPRQAIDAVLAKHPGVATIIENRWLRLVSLEPETGEFYEAYGGGTWRKISLSGQSISVRSCELAADVSERRSASPLGAL